MRFTADMMYFAVEGHSDQGQFTAENSCGSTLDFHSVSPTVKDGFCEQDYL